MRIDRLLHEDDPVLRSLDAARWSRRGSLEGVGTISLDDLCRMMAEHDRGHRAEIEAWLRDVAGRTKLGRGGSR